MFGRHCSDDQLLAFLDGELEGRGAAGVARHLESCWLCRGRQQELEAVAQRLARVVDSTAYPDAEWLAAARERLDAAIDRREAALDGTPARPNWWKWILVPAACVAAAASVYLVSRPSAPVPVAPKPVVRTPMKTAPVSVRVPAAAPTLPRRVEAVPVRDELHGELTLRVNEQDVLATVVAADYVLHRAGACLGESVEATATPDGGIVVHGVVETAARRTQLEASLAQVPGIRVELKAADEAPIPAIGELPAASITVEPVEMPLREALEAHFRSDPQPARAVAAFASRAAELAMAARAEAWALRRLAEKYPAEKTGTLRAASRWLLEDMIREHSAAARQRSAALREHLAIVFGRDAAEPGSSAAKWPESQASLTETAEEVDNLARGLFAGGALDRNPAEAVRHLMTRASAMESAASELERTAYGILQSKDTHAQQTAPTK